MVNQGHIDCLTAVGRTRVGTAHSMEANLAIDQPRYNRAENTTDLQRASSIYETSIRKILLGRVPKRYHDGLVKDLLMLEADRLSCQGYESVTGLSDHTSVYLKPVIRCYKCHAFGHKAGGCRARPACGRCAATATSHNLGADGRIICNRNPRCANCKGPHPVWARECAVYQAELSRANRAYLERPTNLQRPSKRPPIVLWNSGRPKMPQETGDQQLQPIGSETVWGQQRQYCHSHGKPASVMRRHTQSG